MNSKESLRKLENLVQLEIELFKQRQKLEILQEIRDEMRRSQNFTLSLRKHHLAY